MRATKCCVLFLMLWALFATAIGVWADNPNAQDLVTITNSPDGGYAVSTASYQAKIAADGNLHSLSINGIEFLDDHTAASMGASFFAEHPITLSLLRRENHAIIAGDPTGMYSVKYLFEPGYVTITVRHTNPKGAAYVAVCTPQVVFVEDQATSTVAAAPVNYNWSNIKVTVPTGESLELHGGSRIWGREIERQVWERSNLAPNKDYTLMFVPARDAPPTPTLTQLTMLTATMNHPDQLIPKDESAELRVHFDNNSNRAITSEMLVHIESSDGKVLLDDRKAFACDPHQSENLSWTVTPDTPDFYKVQLSVNLEATPKTLQTTFGYDIASIVIPPPTPADFSNYWGRVVAEAKAAPVRLSMLEDASRSTNVARVYEIGIEADGFTSSGWLSIPKYPGRYPGLLILPSDRLRNIGPNPALAGLGFVVMSIEPTGQSVRNVLKPLISRASVNLANPATFGLRAIMIRCLRAVTALSTVQEVDANRLAVTGAGLGGSMAMMLAALDDRIQAVAPDVPYYCHIDQGSARLMWPYLEVNDFLGSHPEQRDEVMKTLRYYDVANFAKMLTCPVFISAGIDDPYSMPKNIVSVSNQIVGPHAITIYLAGHEGGGVKHWEAKMRWFTRVLGGPGPVPPTVITPPVGVVLPVASENPVVPVAPVTPTAPVAPVAPVAPAVNPIPPVAPVTQAAPGKVDTP